MFLRKNKRPLEKEEKAKSFFFKPFPVQAMGFYVFTVQCFENKTGKGEIDRDPHHFHQF